MNLWSNTGGIALFDLYSFQHIICFMAITILLLPLFEKYTIIAVVALTIAWEIFEDWAFWNFIGLPFVGEEVFINRFIGDPISNLIGYFLAVFLIRRLYEQR